MAVQQMKFVLVNNRAPRNPSVCAGCARPLEQSYLHDLFTSKRYCGVECHAQLTTMSEFVGTIGATDPFEFAIAWPKLTVDVASALFDSAWSNPRG